MSLRTLLIAIIVAGFFAGLVLVSRSLGGLGGADSEKRVRGIGIDAVSVVEVRVESEALGVQVARREVGTVDGWVLQITEDESDVWGGDATRIRTVLRALSTASLSVVDEEKIGEVYGTLSLVDGEEMITEVRFGIEAVGGFVRAEIVSRGGDGIATSRWFGRVERGLRDSLFADGLNAWRSMGLFDFTMSEVFGAKVRAGNESVELVRDGDGWKIGSPWVVGADSEVVRGMVGLTLGLVAERFYDEGVYGDELTGLDLPVAQIAIEGREVGASIEIGSAVDTKGKEIFARYTVGDGRAVVVAIKTEGLNRLTAAPLAYVHQTASLISRADVGGLRILGAEGEERFACGSRLDSWEVDGVVVSVSQKAAIDRLVGVVTAEKSGRVFELGEDAVGKDLGTIELVSRDGVVELFSVSIESGDGGIRLFLSRGVGEGAGLVWVCGSAEAGGTGAWIGALVAGGDE